MLTCILRILFQAGSFVRCPVYCDYYVRQSNMSFRLYPVALISGRQCGRQSRILWLLCGRQYSMQSCILWLLYQADSGVCCSVSCGYYLRQAVRYAIPYPVATMSGRPYSMQSCTLCLLYQASRIVCYPISCGYYVRQAE